MPVRTELRDAAAAALALTLLGVVLGLLWLWLAPRVPMISDGRAVYLLNAEGEEAIGAEGTFVLLSLAAGALAGVVAFLFRRRGGVGLVIGLAAGAFVGALLAWRLGVWLGPASDLAAHAREVGKGKEFDGPLKLDAKGTLLAYPFAALLVHLLATAIFGEADPEPPAEPAAYKGPQGEFEK
ncbi:ABC transporter permease [Streptomyces sp. N2-109]|uniref:ABC transporter permease n=1 Tax=Streptomyces gossypii TaxID=2883101 RepID=A0ABT2K2C5_9ACTN|nr:ABC transporter permease [Streptomyces gossypii]MCT2594321.1 ABC transporter permease [Streptomyces gossypii]